MKNQQGALQYADRDHIDLGSYYLRHVSAMTGEALHSKSAIAAELAHRDREIDRLQAENANLNAGYAAARLEIESLQARIKTMAEEHADELMVAHMDGRMRAAQPAGAQQPGAAYAALPDADRDYMRKVVAVAVTMLFDGYKEDVTRVFSTGELSEFVTITAAMGGERVEGIYRRAWDLLSLPVRASHGQAPAQAAPAYKDSTPELHVGDSAFENWYSTYNPAHKADKQRARDAYAAGMGDPLVTAAPAAVAGPSVTDAMALAFHSALSDGAIGSDEVEETKAGLRAALAAAPAQPAPQQEAQEPVAWNSLTDEDRERAMKSMPDMLEGFMKTWGWLHFATAIEAICREKNQPKSPAAQGNALDAEQHEMDAKHAAIYRWMLGHVADVLSIFDNWLADEEADTDELHDALAARAALEGK